jgi:RNA polymerase primary sigma factor
MIASMQTLAGAPSPASEYLGAETRFCGLPRDEVERLAARIADGDREARNLLVKANLGLVRRVARRYVGRGLAIDDLVGEGNLGLIRAAEEFDPEGGASFSTYATYWIKQSILSAVMNTADTIRVPAHVFRLLTRWRRTERSLGLAIGRPPNSDEVASEMGLNDQQKHLVIKALRARDLRSEGVLPVGSRPWSGGLTGEGYEGPEDLLEADEERSCLYQRLRRLDSRERAVLTLRYGLGDDRPMTLQEVGRRLGVSREWARKLVDQAVSKLLDSSPANHNGIVPDRHKPTLQTGSKALKRLADAPRSTAGHDLTVEPASSNSHLGQHCPESPPAVQDSAGLALCG